MRLFQSFKKSQNIKKKNFNLIVAGYGGQGIITLTELISRAALKQDYQVKQAELHGLAQRGGSVITHVRFGQELYSPKVKRASADLIMAIDLVEAYRSCYWANCNNTIVLSDYAIFWPYEKNIDKDKIISGIESHSKRLELVEAIKEIKELTGKIASVNVYLFGLVIHRGFLPIKKEIAWEVISESLKPDWIEENKRVFEYAFQDNPPEIRKEI